MTWDLGIHRNTRALTPDGAVEKIETESQKDGIEVAGPKIAGVTFDFAGIRNRRCGMPAPPVGIRR
jgi:hypothetical protein